MILDIEIPMIQYISPQLVPFGMAIGDLANPGNLTSIVVGGAIIGVAGVSYLSKLAKLKITSLSFALMYGLMRLFGYQANEALIVGVVVAFLGFATDLSAKTARWYRQSTGSGNRQPILGSNSFYTRLHKWADLDQNP